MWIIWRESLLLSVSRCCASSQGSSRQTAENWIVRVWHYWPKTAPLTSWSGLVSTPRWWSITCTTSCPVKRLPTKRCLTGYSFFTLGTGWGPTWLHCPQTSPGPWFWRGSRSLHQHCTTSIGYNWGIMNVLIHLCLAPPVQSTRLKYCYRLGCNHILLEVSKIKLGSERYHQYIGLNNCCEEFPLPTYFQIHKLRFFSLLLVENLGRYTFHTPVNNISKSVKIN